MILFSDFTVYNHSSARRPLVPSVAKPWIDEVERQWRAFAAYYPAIPKVELEWSKETGGITAEHLEAVAALARPPLWQTRGVNASGVLRHSNSHVQPRASTRASSSMDPGDESVMAREVAEARSLTVRRFVS